MSARHYTLFDQILMHLDTGLRTVAGAPVVTERANPADGLPAAELDDTERRHVAGLMRVNHAGEVAAQGLYQGQALTARLPQVRDKMERAALEENDHLAWCKERLDELGAPTSRLNPLWYLGSVAIGAAAGAAGDKWSLGFVAETEHQVMAHLDRHLAELPAQDARSRAILEQMKVDEGGHATTALCAGGAALPRPIRALMGLTSKIMTRTSYRF